MIQKLLWIPERQKYHIDAKIWEHVINLILKLQNAQLLLCHAVFLFHVVSYFRAVSRFYTIAYRTVLIY
jgi:hypothetical protein